MNLSFFHDSRARARQRAVQFRAEISKMVPNWKWKIDGAATGLVLGVLILDRTQLKLMAIGPWMNIIAIFGVGLVLHRNLKRNRGRANPGLLRRIVDARRSRG